MNSRLETKYVITKNQAIFLSESLASVFPRDTNSEISGGYSVLSLYLDTKNFKAFYDKEEGEFYKEKWRLRLYNQNTNEIHLEKKIKEGKRSSKIIYKDYSSKLMEINLEPKLIVHYKRDAFQTNQIRITIDSDLSFSKASFLNDISCYLPEHQSELCILEIKQTEDLDHPVIQHLIYKLDLRPSAFSKYSHGVRSLYDLP